ncbi:DUF309 domain-containing protein [Paenibacillaceae bacterium WGS1546]|uniref:DUF309 domain-containing protein n=1 Tax=Cohnella sp. WGS1546 TaxID=3366810 RepID=UPI00372D2C3F
MSTIEYPKAYVAYLAEYYGSRDYFECHEIMEEYWKENPRSEWRTCWLVLIRIAVGLYHARRGNWKGAAKLMGKAAGEAEARSFDRLGLDGSRLKEQLERTAREWTGPGAAYADMDLPIVDARLLDEARKLSAERGYAWGIGGLQADSDVIHRHLTRDRSEVVQARAEAAARKAATSLRPDKRNRS